MALIEEDKKPKLLWEYVIGNRAPGPVVLGPQDTLRLHCCDGFLHCLDAATGKQVWSPASVGEPLGYAVPLVDRDGNTWVSSADGGLARVDYQGRIQKPPFFRSRQKFDSPAVVADGVLYVGSELGYLFAIDLRGDRGVNQWNHANDQGYVGIVRAAPIVTPDKLIVVAGQDECLYGLASAGTLAWKTQMPGQILGSPVADRHGHIYLGLCQAPRGSDPRGVLVCLDGNSHKVRWEYRTAAPVESTPVIGDDDLVYFGDNAGVIHAVNFFGKAQWTAERRLAGPFGRHALRAAAAGLRPGQRDLGGARLLFRRSGRRRLAQGRPHAGAERAVVGNDMTAPMDRSQDGSPRWTAQTVGMGVDILDRMERAVAKVRERLLRATAALNQAKVPYAVVGGNAVASWVATVDEGAVRTTRDVDLLVRRGDLPEATTALERVGFVAGEVLERRHVPRRPRGQAQRGPTPAVQW